MMAIYPEYCLCNIHVHIGAQLFAIFDLFMPFILAITAEIVHKSEHEPPFFYVYFYLNCICVALLFIGYKRRKPVLYFPSLIFSASIYGGILAYCFGFLFNGFPYDDKTYDYLIPADLRESWKTYLSILAILLSILSIFRLYGFLVMNQSRKLLQEEKENGQKIPYTQQDLDKSHIMPKIISDGKISTLKERY